MVDFGWLISGLVRLFILLKFRLNCWVWWMVDRIENMLMWLLMKFGVFLVYIMFLFRVVIRNVFRFFSMVVLVVVVGISLVRCM